MTNDSLHTEHASLVGLFCHVRVGDSWYQGEVVRESPAEVVVQWFSFLDGAPTNAQVIDRALFLRASVLYTGNDDMKWAGDRLLTSDKLPNSAQVTDSLPNPKEGSIPPRSAPERPKIVRD